MRFHIKSLKISTAFFSLLLIFNCLFSFSLPAHAVTRNDMNVCGFNPLPESGYGYCSWYFYTPYKQKHYINGRLIGECTWTVARARTVSPNSEGYYHDVFLVKGRMDPQEWHSNYTGGWIGINYKNYCNLTISNTQVFTNMAPLAQMPVASESYSFSFGVSGNANYNGNWGGSVGASISTGYSQTTSKNCIDISARWKSISNTKTINIT